MALPVTRGVSAMEALPGVGSSASPSAIREQIPKEMTLKATPAYSLIQSKKRHRLVPTTQGTYTLTSGSASQNIINIPISTGSYVDLSTAFLSFQVTADKNGGNRFVAEAPSHSWLEEIRVYAGGLLVEKIENVSEYITLVKNGAMGPEFRTHNDSFSGDWVDSDASSDGLAVASGQTIGNLVRKQGGVVKSLQQKFLEASQAQEAGQFCVLPLSFLGICNSLETYWPNDSIPLRLQLVMKPSLQQAVVTLADTVGIDAGASLTIDRLELNLDLIKPDAAYADAMRSLLAGSGNPIVYPITTVESQEVTINSVGTSPTSLNVITNQGHSYLKQVYIVTRKSGQKGTITEGALNFPKFLEDTNSDCRLKINTSNYPDLSYRDINQVYFGALDSFGRQVNVEAPWGINRASYTKGTIGYGDGANDSVPEFVVGRHFVGYNLEQYTASPRARTGVNSSALGFSLQQQGRYSSGDVGGTINIDFLHFFRFLTLVSVQGNQVQVIQP